MVADFSIQDAAFTGFGVVREHRGYVPIWAGMAFVVSLAIIAAIIVVAGPAMMTLEAVSASGSRDPATLLPLLSRLAPLYVVLLPSSAVFYGVLSAAMNRAVLRPEEHKFAYLAFGADEFRQIGLLVAGTILFSATYIILVICVVIVITLLGSLAHVPFSRRRFPRRVNLHRFDDVAGSEAFPGLGADVREATADLVRIMGAHKRAVLVDLRNLCPGARPGRRDFPADVAGHHRGGGGGYRRKLVSSFRVARSPIAWRLLHRCATRSTRPSSRSFRVGVAGHPHAAGRHPASDIKEQRHWRRGGGRPLSTDDLQLPHPPISPRQVAAAVVGNALEFYDFTIYAFFAVQIGHNFFPNHSPFISLMLSLATFGAGFILRPLGAIAIGRFADRRGRRPAMLFSFALMGVAILGVALTPSYADDWPEWRPILVLIWRLCQGFALGGEVGPTTAYLVEASPPAKPRLVWRMARRQPESSPTWRAVWSASPSRV